PPRGRAEEMIPIHSALKQMKITRPALYLVLAASLAATGAIAAGPKSDYAIKTRYVEIGVHLDPATRANAPLAADSLKEGKAWAAKCRADARAATRDAPVAISASRPWTFERKYQLRSMVAGRYLSLVRSDYMDTGGAHPNSDVDTVLWDNAQK